MERKQSKRRFWSGGVRRKLIAFFVMLSVLFCLILVCSYMNSSLQTAYEMASRRTESTAAVLQAKLKSIFVSAATLCQNQRIATWLNAASLDSMTDLYAIQDAKAYCRANLEVLCLALYNETEERLVEVDANLSTMYRSVERYEEQDVLDLLLHPYGAVLHYEVIRYRGEDAIAFALPHSMRSQTRHKRMAVVLSPSAVAQSVSGQLSEQAFDGSTTFVEDEEGRVLMGQSVKTLPDEIRVLDGQPSGWALLTSLLGTGYIACETPLRLQGWQVCSVVYVDAFFASHMPLVKMMLGITAFFLLLLLFLIFWYFRMTRRPYSKLASDLSAHLPSRGATTAAGRLSDEDIVKELQQGIHYLLRYAADMPPEGLNSSQLNAWANSLGTDSQMAIDRSLFFPRAKLQMAIARVADYDALRTDYFMQRSIRQSIGRILKEALQARWTDAYCVDTGDGCFTLLISTDSSTDERALKERLTDAAAQIRQQTRLRTVCAASPLLDVHDNQLNGIYQSLYRATFLSVADNDCSVYSIDDVLAYEHSQEAQDDHEAIEAIVGGIRARDESALRQSVAAYVRRLDDMARDVQQKSLSSFCVSLLYSFNRRVTGESYQRIQRIILHPVRADALEDALLAVCQSILREASDPPVNHAQWHTIILDVMEYIQSNIADPQLSVESVAVKEGYSVNYIRSMFKNYAGMSISDYIRDRRVDMACRLLASTDAPIPTIMENSGFYNRTSFFNQIKANTGMTPSEYRSSRQGGA